MDVDILVLEGFGTIFTMEFVLSALGKGELGNDSPVIGGVFSKSKFSLDERSTGGSDNVSSGSFSLSREGSGSCNSEFIIFVILGGKLSSWFSTSGTVVSEPLFE